MTRTITGATMVAGVAGSPVTHSLSPLIHNAWLEAAGIDGVYVAFSPAADGFAAFAGGFRAGSVRGLNVTVPFKADALAAANRATAAATRAGAANLLTFAADGTIAADNTDGVGLLGALTAQAPGFDPTTGPAVIFGAGGAARGAAAALLTAGAPLVRIVNRTLVNAEELARAVGGEITAHGTADGALADVNVNINATTLGLGGGDGPLIDFAAAPETAVVMDMVYRPLSTAFLLQAAASGLRTVDGLEMLIRQAAPSFEAFFGQPPPDIDVRALALTALEKDA